MQDLGGQVRREGAEGEVSPILPSPGPRRAAACWQRRERSGRHRLGECLICGIPQIIRAAGNVGQGWRIPSPASAPDAAGGRKGSGGEGNPGASLSCPPQLLPGPRAPPSSTFGGLLERRSSGSCPPSALVGARNAAGRLYRAVASPRLRDLSLASLTSASLISHMLSWGLRCHPTGVCVSVPSLRLPKFLQPRWRLRDGEEAELPAGSLARAGAAGEAAVRLPGAGVGVFGQRCPLGFHFSAFR